MEQLQPIEHQTQRILTTAQLATAYGTDEKYIRKNFENNKARYTLGKHYFLLEGDELKKHLALHASFLRLQNIGKIRSLYLWTEKGALLHAKSLNTDKAWEAYEKLIDEYYRQLVALPQPPTYTLGDALRERALLNEDHVPSDLFGLQVEGCKELYYLERLVNETLDTSAQIEISIGKCWPAYAVKVLGMSLSERRRYRHRLPDGRVVEAWGYPLKYLPDFRKWLRETYFVEKFPAYQRYRAKRIGAQPIQINAPASKKIAQLEMFPVA